MDELLPCPFCAGRTEAGENLNSAWAACTECPAHIVRIDGTVAEAVAAWNRRSQLNVERLVEALTAMVGRMNLLSGDQKLADAYRAAWDAAEEADLDFDEVNRRAFRALVLAALGPVPEPPLADPIAHALLQNPD